MTKEFETRPSGRWTIYYEEGLTNDELGPYLDFAREMEFSFDQWQYNQMRNNNFPCYIAVDILMNLREYLTAYTFCTDCYNFMSRLDDQSGQIMLRVQKPGDRAFLVIDAAPYLYDKERFTYERIPFAVARDPDYAAGILSGIYQKVLERDDILFYPIRPGS